MNPLRTFVERRIEKLAEEAEKKKRPTRNDTMLELASVIARRSTCGRRQVGCVLTDAQGRVLSMGHNGVPRGHPHCTETPCPGVHCASGAGLELCSAVHAEQNALMFCPDTMRIDACYVTTAPCVHCVKMLMNTSCREIHFLEEYAHLDARKLWTTRPDGLTPSRMWVHHG